jgi:hypothetical protein
MEWNEKDTNGMETVLCQQDRSQINGQENIGMRLQKTNLNVENITLTELVLLNCSNYLSPLALIMHEQVNRRFATILRAAYCSYKLSLKLVESRLRRRSRLRITLEISIKSKRGRHSFTRSIFTGFHHLDRVSQPLSFLFRRFTKINSTFMDVNPSANLVAITDSILGCIAAVGAEPLKLRCMEYMIQDGNFRRLLAKPTGFTSHEDQLNQMRLIIDTEHCDWRILEVSSSDVQGFCQAQA